MTTFWQIIDTARARSETSEEHTLAEALYWQLLLWSSDEIESFDTIFHDLHRKSYSMQLWNTLRHMYGFVSNDGFDYFRAWLIMQGETVYSQVLRNPKTLVEFAVGESYPECELAMHVAGEVYKEKTGRELPWIEQLEQLH
jgi:hypothetical protein